MFEAMVVGSIRGSTVQEATSEGKKLHSGRRGAGQAFANPIWDASSLASGQICCRSRDMASNEMGLPNVGHY